MKSNLAIDISEFNIEVETKSAKVMRKIVDLQNKRYEECSIDKGITAYRVVPRYDVYSVGWS